MIYNIDVLAYSDEERKELYDFLNSYACNTEEEELARDFEYFALDQKIRARRIANLTHEEIVENAKMCIDYAIVNQYYVRMIVLKTENEIAKDATGKNKDFTSKGAMSIKPDGYEFPEGTHEVIINNNLVLDPATIRSTIQTVNINAHLVALADNDELYNNVIDYLSDRVDSWALVISEYIESGKLNIPSNEDKKAILRSQSYIPSYHGKATDNFAYMSGTTPTGKTKVSKNAKFEYNDTTIQISDFSKNSLSINPHKLLSVAMGEFTANNTYHNPHSNKKRSGNVQYRTTFSEEDYYKACGLDVETKPTSTPEEEAKEKERAMNAKKSARKRLKSDLETLLNSKVYFTEKGKNGELKNFSGLNYIGGYSVKDGIITITLSVDLGDYLLSKPITQYPTALLGVDSRNENAYNLGLKMSEYYSLDNNVITGQYNRLKVESLLKVMRIDIDDIIKNDLRHWDRRIKEPLENALDHLVEKGVLTIWEYVRTKGEPIPDNEAYIETYEEYKETLIHFELKDAPNPHERLERRKIERLEAQKSTGNKKKRTDKKKK